LIISLLIVLCITFGPYLCYRKKAMFSMILVIFNFIIFFIMFLGVFYDPQYPNTLVDIYGSFGFAPNYLVGKSSYIADYSPALISSIFTHMFIHSYFSFFHILMNMIFLLFLGMPFEEKVGPWVFMAIYFISGLFGSIFTALFALLTGGALGQDPAIIGIGASGAIFGILGAFIGAFPGEKILFPLILIRKWPIWMIAAIYFGIETLLAIQSVRDGVGHFAHIGGFIGGLFFIPLIRKFQSVHDKARALDTLDFNQLEKFATNYKLKDILERVKREDEPEVRDVWLEEFLKNIKCPECGKKLMVRPHLARCTCGFKIRY
jgi:membrane associated rhomboid family serine protease